MINDANMVKCLAGPINIHSRFYIVLQNEDGES